MVRTMIQLPEEQMRRLRARARRDGVSVAETVRRFVAKGLEEPKPDTKELYARAATCVGAFRDVEGATDVARNHDKYLAEIYAGESRLR